MARLPYTIPYDPDFLGDGFQVPLPIPCSYEQLVNKGQVLDYIHFSLVMHEARKTALYTAHNIDTAQKQLFPRKNDSWKFDSRIDKKFQMGALAYGNNPYDKGHLTRRDAVVWGENLERAKAAAAASFYYTNSALQHKAYNRSHEKWLGLEEWVLKSAGKIHNRLCVFNGPIYTDVDNYTGAYRVPAAFWKIVVLRDPSADGADVSAVAFMMKQNEDWGKTSRRLLDPTPYQVPIRAIEGYTGLEFEHIRKVDEFQWQTGSRSLQSTAEIPIYEATDIIFAGRRRRARGIRMQPISARGVVTRPAPIDDKDLYISAVLPNPKGIDTGNEWIEITNKGAHPINLLGHQVMDKQGGVLALEGTIKPGATQRVPIPKNHKIKLANTGDEIRLLRGAILLHLVNYSKTKQGEVLTFDAWEAVEEVEEVLDLIPGAERC